MVDRAGHMPDRLSKLWPMAIRVTSQNALYSLSGWSSSSWVARYLCGGTTVKTKVGQSYLIAAWPRHAPTSTAGQTDRRSVDNMPRYWSRSGSGWRRPASATTLDQLELAVNRKTKHRVGPCLRTDRSGEKFSVVLLSITSCSGLWCFFVLERINCKSNLIGFKLTRILRGIGQKSSCIPDLESFVKIQQISLN
jgi:hypothetical protein